MDINALIQYASIAAALVLLWIIRKGVKKYLPVAVLAIAYSMFIDHLGYGLDWWHYDKQVFYWFHDDAQATLDYIVYPVLVTTFTKYVPRNLLALFVWSAGGTVFGGGIEYLLEKYTEILYLHHTYNIWYSIAIWFFSWSLLYSFHVWYHGEKFFSGPRWRLKPRIRGS